MPRIVAGHVHAVELPFRVRFEHSAASRRSSSSVFVELQLDDGTSGWGESLPRPYVTGETQDGACRTLAQDLLPRLLGRSFDAFDEVLDFLRQCDGLPPAGWTQPEPPQPAAWCAVDLALIDAFGRSFGGAPSGGRSLRSDLIYSGVLSSGRGWKTTAQLLAYRALGFRELKLKIDRTTTEADLARVRRLAGPGIALRADVNMGWAYDEALERMPAFARCGVRSFEQPLPADDLTGAARLARLTGLDVMADESLSTRDSLQRLIGQRACTAINARISKCGGWVATLARCREAHAAGLRVQIGCQVGESSLLSAAHLHLCAAFHPACHAEGCFGSWLLAADPARPGLRFGAGGRPPALPHAAGLGVEVDRDLLARHRAGYWRVPA